MRWVLVLVLLAGCEGCGGETVQTAMPSTESSSGSTVGTVGAAPPPGTAEPPTGVEVRTEVDRYGNVTVAVENRSSEVVRLAPALGESLTLRVECDAEPPACIELVPGAVLYPCDCGGCEHITAETPLALRACR